jgi:hypothetical protein
MQSLMTRIAFHTWMLVSFAFPLLLGNLSGTSIGFHPLANPLLPRPHLHLQAAYPLGFPTIS